MYNAHTDIDMGMVTGQSEPVTLLYFIQRSRVSFELIQIGIPIHKASDWSSYPPSVNPIENL